MEGQDVTALEQLNAYLATLFPRRAQEVRYLFEERAGIAQDSGATREQAEQIAWDEVRPKGEA
jgi:hypothetical protein